MIPDDDEINISDIIDNVKELQKLENQKIELESKIEAIKVNIESIKNYQKIDNIFVTSKQINFIYDTLIPLAKTCEKQKIGEILNILDIGINLNSKLIINYDNYYCYRNTIYD